VHSLPTAQLTLERGESSRVLQVKLRGIMEQLKQVAANNIFELECRNIVIED